MLRRLGGATAVVVAAATLSLGGCQSCSGFANDFAEGVHGEATPRAAVTLWLTHAENGYDRNPNHWEPSAENPLVFHSGSSTLTVVEFRPPGSGYLVGAGSSC